MPVDTHYVDMGKGAYKHAYATLTSKDLLVASMLQSQDIENTRRLKFILYDYVDVSEVRVTLDAITQLAEWCRTTASFSPGMLAAVVAPNPLLFGLARNWQTLTANIGWRTQIFHNRGDAIAWLRKELAGEGLASPFLDEFPQLKAQCQL